MSQETGTLITDKRTYTINEQITITGTGFHHSPPTNVLKIIVWDAPVTPTITSLDKQGNFTATVEIGAPGSYNILAYNNEKSIIGGTSILVEG